MLIFVYNPTQKKIQDVDPQQLKFLRRDRYRLTPAPTHTLRVRADILRSPLMVFQSVCDHYSNKSSAYRTLEELQLTSLMCHLNAFVHLNESAPGKPHEAQYARGNAFIPVCDHNTMYRAQLDLFPCGKWFITQSGDCSHELSWRRESVGSGLTLMKIGEYSEELIQDIRNIMGYLTEKFPSEELVFCITPRQKFVVLCGVANKYWSRVIVPYITNMHTGLNLHWATRAHPNSLPEQRRRDIVLLLSWRGDDKRIRKQISWNRLIRTGG